MNRSSERINPEVTVLMSCYNAARWLHVAIDSVLNQTFDNFEFILVDDGSSDETWEIIQSYCDSDDRVITISKKNTGLADSLNVGISRARGTWIARIDADDICEPSRLEEQLKFVQNYPEVILLGTGFIEIDEHGRPIKKHLYPTEHRKLVQNLERSQRFFPHSSAFYRKDVVAQSGGYNLRINRAEDRRLWLELSLKGKVASLPKPLVRIRKHDSQISLDDNGRRSLCDATAATVSYFLRKAGYQDPSIDADLKEWEDFLTWVECRMEESGTFKKRKTWADARVDYFSTNNKFVGLLRFGSRVFLSGQAIELILEKIVGTSLPQRLAQSWIKRSTTV